MDARNEILDAIQILIGRALESTTKIYNATCKGLVSGNVALMLVNGVNTNVVFYGDTPDVNKQYRVFVPEGNMSNAFMITGGGTGSSNPTVVDYNALVGKPSINGTTVQGNQTSKDLKLYGDGNQPPYPVTSVNGQTGDVTLTKSNVGLGNVDNVKQYSASNPPPYPVTSVNGKTGAVNLSASDVGAVPTSRTVNGHSLSNNVTITKSDVGLGSVANERQYSANNPPPYPVTSVNGQTGAVNIDVGGGGVDIVLSRTQPSGLKAGDYWYQIVT